MSLIRDSSYLSRFTSRSQKLTKERDIYIYLYLSARPVAALISYLAIRGPAPGPLFRLTDSSLLTKDCFIKHVRTALSSLGYNSATYASHGFRIGTTTTATEWGIEDSVIKALGRWKSDAPTSRFPEIDWRHWPLYSVAHRPGGTGVYSHGHLLSAHLLNIHVLIA